MRALLRVEAQLLALLHQLRVHGLAGGLGGFRRPHTDNPGEACVVSSMGDREGVHTAQQKPLRAKNLGSKLPLSVLSLCGYLSLSCRYLQNVHTYVYSFIY